jgi:hypothetical protein
VSCYRRHHAKQKLKRAERAAARRAYDQSFEDAAYAARKREQQKEDVVPKGQPIIVEGTQPNWDAAAQNEPRARSEQTHARHEAEAKAAAAEDKEDKGKKRGKRGADAGDADKAETEAEREERLQREGATSGTGEGEALPPFDPKQQRTAGDDATPKQDVIVEPEEKPSRKRH